VATHSLINYAQWQIVSPESSLLNVGADEYIAQVWVPREVTIGGKRLDPDQYQPRGRTLLLRFSNTTVPQRFLVRF
jgi:hypothetical protein